MAVFRQDCLVVTATIAMSFLLLLLLGCQDGRPKRFPVSGVVLLNGKPLTHGTIRFYPQGGRPAAAKIDKQGRFILSCFEQNDGVVPGTHPVAVDASEMLDETTVRWYAPPHYASPQTSGITKTIEGPTSSLKIELTWDKQHRKPFTQKTRTP
jgi:hypothetical protein